MKNFRRARNSGVILIAVLGCLAVSLSLVLAAIHASIQSRQECKQAHWMTQTHLLGEAGAMHAMKKLRMSADYEGELWQPKFATESTPSASVLIQVDRPNDVEQAARPSVRKITVIARLETDERSTHAIQRTFHWTFQLNPLSPSETE